MSTAAKLIKEKKNLLPKNAPVPNRRILVVDDEPEIGAAIERLLSPPSKGAIPIRRRSSRSQPQEAKSANAEFDVTVVSTPGEALTAVKQAMVDGHPFAMGFFDVMLGAEIDGIELVRQIFAVDTKIFAMFVTAYQDRSVDAIGSLLGDGNRERWDYINKPFSEGEIVQKARNATSLWDLHRLKEWQEERLSEAQQLLMANERQNVVAAVGRSLAHEFGNLLMHIVGNAEIALMQETPGGERAALELILKATDTAKNILGRFSRMHGSIEKAPKHEHFDMRRIVEEALELIEFQLRKHSINATIHQEGPAVILGNRHSFVQVYVNLFINSMHAMPDGGEIQIHLHGTKEHLEIAVRDTGPGVPESVLDRVTEPMFTTKGSQGTGLGLSICKEIVEIDHGGEMSVHNHPKGGFEVTFRVPTGEEGSR